ncbi:MAG TPA: hypothetical protein VEA37_05940 [Flavobacterium sp.]|nr:hypothetical protein [Flavobacterium sp.]
MKKTNLKMYLGALAVAGCLMVSCKDNTTGSETGGEGTDNAEYHTGTPAGSDNTGGSGDETRTDAEGTTRTGTDTVTTTTNNGNSTAQGSGTDNVDSRNGRE